MYPQNDINMAVYIPDALKTIQVAFHPLYDFQAQS